MVISLKGTTCNSTCSFNEFKCLNNSQCIRREYLCDHGSIEKLFYFKFSKLIKKI